MNIIPLNKLIISAKQASNGEHRATGLVENAELLYNMETIELLRQYEEMIYCYMAFDNIIDQSIFQYIESGGLASESGDKILFLYTVSKKVPTYTRVKTAELLNLLEVRNESNTNMQILQSLFLGDNNFTLPGILLFDRELNSSKIIYITLMNRQLTDKVDCIRHIIEIIKKSDVKTRRNGENFIDEVGTQLMIADFTYSKNSKYSFGESIVKIFKILMFLKSDLIAIVAG